MTTRYFTQTPVVGDRTVLTGPEAHHLIHVMRATAGTEVTLFDGSGFEFLATVEKLGRTEVQLAVLGRVEIDRELPIELTLAVALPKGDRQKWLVEKAVELGVTRIVPLRSEHSVAQPVQKALVRLQRTVVEASKQCGRNRLLDIAEPQDWTDLVERTGHVARRLVAHPGQHSEAAEPAAIAPIPTADGPPGGVLAAIGPEGGFSSEEIALATAAGWTCVDLGPRVLRIETAALMLVALLVGSAQA